MRLAIVLALGALAAAARGQSPDFDAFVELRPTWQVRSGAKNVFRYYDPIARYSLVGLRLRLEPGLRVLVAQRIEKAPGDGDPEGIDEAWLEDPGLWRIGKQYLPFGRGLLRESVNAVRFDVRTALASFPLRIAACDGGSGRPRAIVGRAGRSFGASFAVGDSIGIQQTSFTLFRDPEDAPGRGAGHRVVLGVDAEREVGSVSASAEWVGLRAGARGSPDLDFSELRARIVTRKTGYPVAMSWGREWKKRRDVYRIEAELGETGSIVYVPSIRIEGFRFRDFSLSAVIRL